MIIECINCGTQYEFTTEEKALYCSEECKEQDEKRLANQVEFDPSSTLERGQKTMPVSSLLKFGINRDTAKQEPIQNNTPEATEEEEEHD